MLKCSRKWLNTGVHNQAMTIKVAIVEDDSVFRGAVLAMVGEQPDMQMRGVATCQTSGLALLAQPPADVLLVDLGLPGGSGLEVIKQARQSWPQCDIMVISVFGDKGNIFAAIAAGALGYLLKDMPTQQLAQEIRTMHQGGSAISPAIARELLSHLSSAHASSPGPGTLQPASPPLPTSAPQPQSEALTEREHEILVMANKGFSYEEVASALGISIHTVRTHVKRSYTKLQVNSKTQAIYELRRMGKNLA
jgi:DNA-binding NarL/FixJ family response regulator